MPFPPTHGGRVDTYRRLREAATLADIDLVVTVNTLPPREDVDALARHVRRIEFVERERGLAAHLSLQPFQARSRRALRALPLGGPYDLVLLESEHVAPVLANASLRATSRAIRVHNDEVLYFAQLAASSRGLAKFVFFTLERLRCRWSVPAAWDQADFLLFISEDEFRRAGGGRYGDRAHMLPTPFHFEPVDRVDGGTEILFVGSLFMENNWRAVTWYLEEVHARVRAAVPGCGFTVAGNCTGVPAARLDWLRRQPQVRLVESPESIAPLYARAAVFANPMLHGAGTKMKTLNAIEAGVPVVSTTIGAEGLGLVTGEHLLVADDADGFARAIVDALGDPGTARERASRAAAHLTARMSSLNVMRTVLERARSGSMKGAA
jgi:glycosyltransferase involved in cell wall biosynthesis